MPPRARSQTIMLLRACPAAASPSTIAFTMSRWVVNSSPPAAEILMPILSSGDTSDPQAWPRSCWPVAARTRRLTMPRTTAALVWYCLMAEGSCAAKTMDWEGIVWARTIVTAQKKKQAKIGIRTMKGESELMVEGENVQSANGQIRRGERPTVSHLYVHIPFCARICPYCAFYKERADSSQTQRFCEALLHEIDDVSDRFTLRPETIFFGGGTPTALTTAQLECLLGGLRDRLDLSGLVEWTLEANPGSVSPRKAALLRALGVSRISLGVQSWDDDLLKLLGREHDAAQAAASFQVLHEAGLVNVSIDL